MAELEVTNLVKAYTLLLLKKRPMHGYELIKELESHMAKNISASHIYPFLKTLQKNKLVSVKAAGNRDRKEYKLTPTGEKLAQKLIDRFAVLVEISVKPTIKACAHCGCKVTEGSHKEKIKGKKFNFCCVSCAATYKLKEP